MYNALHKRDRDAGVTLIEVLVVLVLVGVMAGVVGLSLGGGGGRGDVVGREADLLVARLNRAADEVILTGHTMSFVWEQDGYRFVVQDGAEWVPHPLALLRELHVFKDTVQFSQTAGAMMLADDMRPAPDAPLTLTLSSRNGAEEGVRFDGINASRIESGI